MFKQEPQRQSDCGGASETRTQRADEELEENPEDSPNPCVSGGWVGTACLPVGTACRTGFGEVVVPSLVRNGVLVLS